MKHHRSLAAVLFSLAIAASIQGCASNQAAPAPQTAAGSSATAGSAPATDKMTKHFHDHVKYPASREQVLAACADTPEFSADEKRWIADRLPNGTYASERDVVSALKL